MSVGRILFTAKFQRFAILVGILFLAYAFYRLDPYVSRWTRSDGLVLKHGTFVLLDSRSSSVA
jgi:hypothetical protein